MLCHLLSGWCLQLTASTNQATAAVAATASAASAFVDPAFTIAVSVTATVCVPASATASARLLLLPHCCFAPVAAPSVTFTLLANAIASPLSLACLLADAKQLLLCHCHGCWQMQQLLHHCQCLCFRVFTAHLHMAPSIAIGLSCCL